jgi:hypothetical protein
LDSAVGSPWDPVGGDPVAGDPVAFEAWGRRLGNAAEATAEAVAELSRLLAGATDDLWVGDAADDGSATLGHAPSGCTLSPTNHAI